jgi:aryl-alcohol dehydrogenase-like predicted oxidoreductase
MVHDEVNRRIFLKGAAASAVAASLPGSFASLSVAAERAGDMPTRLLGRTGLKVSLMALGGFHSGVMESEDYGIRLIHRAIELGVNLMDNADCYQGGRTEERMGKALAGKRDKVILMSKVDARDAAGSRATLERSLRSLKTDHLDLWQFHQVPNLRELDQIFGPGGALETAEKARKEGKIRFIGITAHFDPEVLLAAVRRYPFDTMQMPINVVDPHFKSFRKTVVDEAVKNNIGVIAMKTMGRGNITSFEVATPAEALRYVWSQPVATAVVGSEWIEMLEQNVLLAKTFQPMTGAEQAALLERTKRHAGLNIEAYKAWG